MATFHFIILSIFLLTIQINGYPKGAPKRVCSGPMIPHHQPHKPQPESTNPLTKFSTKWNPDGETISVEIESKKAFEGIFVQGRKINGTEPIGTFINIPSGTQTVQCTNESQAVTHTLGQKWENLKLTWKKPTTMKGQETIQFWATVVVDFAHFWVVKSI